ncbi:hypothetical protein FOZ62_021065, partial [Perkinsus olseni]
SGCLRSMRLQSVLLLLLLLVVRPECVLSAVQGWASDGGFPSGSYRVLDDLEASCDAVAEALMFSVNAVGAELTSLKDAAFAMAGDIGPLLLDPSLPPTARANISSSLFPRVSASVRLVWSLVELSAYTSMKRQT